MRSNKHNDEAIDNSGGAYSPHQLATVAAAMEAAQDFAGLIASSAVARDRDHLLPTAEIEYLRKTGLLAIAVPRRFGGVGIDAKGIAEIVRIIAHADPGIALILHPHFNLAEAVRLGGKSDPDFQAFIYEEMLAGNLFGVAAVERNTKSPQDITATLRQMQDGHYRLDGEKFYCSGALFAKWIHVVARNDAGQGILCMVARDAPGVEVREDWRSVGQRSAACGTTLFHNVIVKESDLRPFNPKPDVIVPWTQLLHAAIPVGIARAAFDDLVAFAREEARPWVDAHVERVSEETHVITQVGTLAIKIQAVEAYLHHAAELTDAARDTPGKQRLTAARMAVAGVKTLATDVALEVGNALLEIGGSRANMLDKGLDRHWRNVRTQATHNSDRWLRYNIGNAVMNDVELPTNGKI